MSGVYGDLAFPEPPADRPWTFINMVSTIDGKILSGERDEPVHDLGSETDYQTLRQIQAAADAVVVGAGTLRATPKMSYGPNLIRVVVSRSGNFDESVPFFTEAPGRAIVATPCSAEPKPTSAEHVSVGDEEFDASLLSRLLRQNWGVRRLLLEGGSELNAAFLAVDIVDEIFLTIAPKIKLGRDVPTIAGGEPLGRDGLQQWDLVSQLTVGSELFLRYRRAR